MIPRRFWKPLGFLLFGGILGWLLPFPSPLSPRQIASYRGVQLRQNSADYKLISPLLSCDIGSENAFPEFVPLKKTLADLIDKRESAGDVQGVSVYLRSLRAARWLEINSDETYAPASLLKIFAMMAFYKEADETDNPSLLQEEVPFEASAAYGANNADDPVGGAIAHLENGKLYTIDQIINQMITYSDNDAYATLLDNFDPRTVHALEMVSTDLTIPLPVTHAENSLDFMTVDKYALVFRVLFGATYLSDRYSQKALELLSQAKYATGIVAGVPSNLTVAHKYGIRAVPAPTTDAPAELHDCGIVYYPDHPYLLCIMTKGNDLVAQQNVIKDLSAAAYGWLDNFYRSLPSSGATSATSPVVAP